MSRSTGRGLAYREHLAQSIGDILTTPVGSRVMRRAYGSDLPRLVDAPMNGETVVDLYVATAEALDRWEPRIRLTRVQIAGAASGLTQLQLDYQDADGIAGTLDVEIGGAR
jgi:phage baseplate assembly protein W